MDFNLKWKRSFPHLIYPLINLFFLGILYMTKLSLNHYSSLLTVLTSSVSQ